MADRPVPLASVSANREWTRHLVALRLMVAIGLNNITCENVPTKLNQLILLSSHSLTAHSPTLPTDESWVHRAHAPSPASNFNLIFGGCSSVPDEYVI